MTIVRDSRIMVGYGRKALQDNAQLFAGPVPVENLRDDLFGWTVEPAPLFATVNGKPILVPSHVANVRSDNQSVLGLTGPTYGIHQFGDSLVSNVERIIGDGINVNAAGYNRGGAVGWVSVSLAASNVTAEGIEYLPQLIAYGSHDGSLVTGYKRSVLNMVCNNQMGAMLSAACLFSDDTVSVDSVKGRVKSNLRIKHSRNSMLRVESAREALGILVETGDTFADAARELCQTTVTDAEWNAIVDELAPLAPEGASVRAVNMADKKRDELHELYRSDDRCAQWQGTAYGAIQTANTWTTHLQTVRGAHRDDRNILATLNGDWDAHDDRTVATVRRVLTRSRG